MKMIGLESMLTSPPDRQNVVFEIWSRNRQVAEISKEPGCGYEIEIYPASNNGAWHLDLAEFKAMLDEGIKELASNP